MARKQYQGQQPSFEDRLNLLRMELLYFNPIIGGWPTRLRTFDEREDAFARWEKARDFAEALVIEEPHSLEAKTALGDLLRMGHNMDVPGAAALADQLLQEVIAVDPDHFYATYSLACLYVTMNPQLAPIAESLLLKAEALSAPVEIADIYQGLGYACLYQDRIEDAIAHFEHVLAMQNHPDIRKLVADLKAGKKPEIVFEE